MRVQYSFEDWMARVEKEIPEGKSISDLLINHNLYKHSGFSWPSDIELKGKLLHDEWKILCHSNSNETILKALELGAESIYIKVDESTNFNDLLKDIRLDYICSVFDFTHSPSSKIKDLEHYIQSNDLYKNLDYYKLTEKHESSCNDISAISDIFQNIIRGLEGGKKEFYIQYKFDLNFYKTVSSLRALRIIFANISKAFEIEDSKLLIECNPDFTTEDFNQQLIKLTFGALSCVIGGCDFISLHSWDNFNEGRLAQNIQHLLKHESNMHIFQDPMAGSYLIEDLTKQIVDSVWKGLSNDT